MSHVNGYIFWITIQILIQIAIQINIQIIIIPHKQGKAGVTLSDYMMVCPIGWKIGWKIGEWERTTVGSYDILKNRMESDGVWHIKLDQIDHILLCISIVARNALQDKYITKIVCYRSGSGNEKSGGIWAYMHCIRLRLSTWMPWNSLKSGNGTPAYRILTLDEILADFVPVWSQFSQQGVGQTRLVLSRHDPQWLADLQRTRTSFMIVRAKPCIKREVHSIPSHN